MKWALEKYKIKNVYYQPVSLPVLFLKTKWISAVFWVIFFCYDQTDPGVQIVDSEQNLWECEFETLSSTGPGNEHIIQAFY